MKASNYLLDTHTLLWATSESAKLSDRVREILESDQHRLFVSSGTLWEISIKQNIQKLFLPDNFCSAIFDFGYERLSIELNHLDAYRKLPILHKNPFDRLLIAQAKSEQLVLLTSDEEMQRYDVDCIW